MLSKELELKIGGQKVQVWFNTFSKFQLMGMYNANTELEFATEMSKRAKDNYLLLLIDLLKAGIKGSSLARKQDTPDIYDNLEMVIADTEMDELLIIWEKVFKAFNEHMGANIKTDNKKKVVRKPKPARKKS